MNKFKYIFEAESTKRSRNAGSGWKGNSKGVRKKRKRNFTVARVTNTSNGIREIIKIGGDCWTW